MVFADPKASAEANTVAAADAAAEAVVFADPKTAADAIADAIADAATDTAAGAADRGGVFR